MIGELLDQLPDWVKSYLLPAVIGAAAAGIAYTAYGSYAEARDREVSVSFWHLEQAAVDGDLDGMQERLDEIVARGTDEQSSLAMLLASSYLYDESLYDRAVAGYDYVIANSDFATLRDIARLRKAQTLLKAGQPSQASEALVGISAQQETAQVFSDIIAGDIHMQEGSVDLAASRYKQALESSRKVQIRELSEILLLKLSLLNASRVRQLQENPS